jgi:hypothetical protein
MVSTHRKEVDTYVGALTDLSIWFPTYLQPDFAISRTVLRRFHFGFQTSVTQEHLPSPTEHLICPKWFG